MTSHRRHFHHTLLAAATALLALSAGGPSVAASAEDLDQDSSQALQTLYKNNATARTLSKNAKAILVFPKVVKAGLVFGGSYGEGVLMMGTRVTDYYNSVSASWGWQVGPSRMPMSCS